MNNELQVNDKDSYVLKFKKVQTNHGDLGRKGKTI